MSAISPLHLLAHSADAADVLFDDIDLLMLSYDPAFTLRPEQWPEHDDWSYLGYVCGRGWGKSFAIAPQIVGAIMRGEAQDIALSAQSEDKTVDLQVKPSLDWSPPWFPATRIGKKIFWPNGATASMFTPESPGLSRGGNFDLTWLSELVAWPLATRWEAFTNITTATRVGRARVIWDTTSMGRNELISYMLRVNEDDPRRYPIIRGQIGDNPRFSREQIQREYAKYSGRRLKEELEGEIFAESQGAIFEQEWLDRYRVDEPPSRLEHVVVGLDPGVSTKEGVDGTGLVVAGRDRDGHNYVLRDRSGVMSSEQWGGAVLDEHKLGAAGVIVETNKGGDTVFSLLKALGRERGVDVRKIAPADVMPRRSAQILYVKPVFSRNDKLTRGMGPSALTANGRVHLVGKFSDLERQLCTYDGEGKSPNNYDAFNEAISELAGIYREGAPPDMRETRAKGAHAAAEQLRARLRAMSSGRSVL